VNLAEPLVRRSHPLADSGLDSARPEGAESDGTSQIDTSGATKRGSGSAQK
jgi:hypothetical protein